jgi:hypothetical protein
LAGAAGCQLERSCWTWPLLVRSRIAKKQISMEFERFAEGLSM